MLGQVDDTGGEPLVLLPGMNCSARLWSRAGLEPAIMPSLTEPSLDAQVERLLDELPRCFALAGLSLGAVVAMALLRRAPERVCRLALLSTNPYAPTSAQRQAWRASRDRLAAGASARELQSDWMPALLSRSARRSGSGLVETTLTMADDVGEGVLDAQLQLQADRVDERPALDRVRCPTTVIAAAQDVMCDLPRHRELATLIPGAQLVVLAGSGHLSPLESPLGVGAALAGWRWSLGRPASRAHASSVA